MSPELKELHVLSVSTESGDDYGPFLFEGMPDDGYLEVFLRRQIPSDELDEPGPGWRDTCVHLEWCLQPVYPVPGISAMTPAEQKATLERWLDKHCLDDTDFNDPPA